MTFFDISRKMLKAGFYKYRLYFLCNLSATALFCCFAVISTNRTFMNASIVNSSISNNIYLPFFLSAVFLVFFLPVSCQAFLASRKQEYGVMFSLGMSRKEAFRNLLFENVIISVLALAIALAAGTVLSFLFFSVIIYAIDVHGVQWQFCPEAYKLTAVLYTVVVAVAFILNAGRLMLDKIGTLLKAQYRAEKTGKIGTFLCRLAPNYMRFHLVEWSFVRRHKKEWGCRYVLASLIIAVSVMLTGVCVTLYPAFLQDAKSYSPYDMVYSEIYGMNQVSVQDVLHILEKNGVTVEQVIQLPYIRDDVFNYLPVTEINRDFGCDYQIQEGEFLNLFQYNLEDGYEHNIQPVSTVTISGDRKLQSVGTDVKILFNQNPTFADKTLIINDSDFEKLSADITGSAGIANLFQFQNWEDSYAGVCEVKEYLQESNQLNEDEQTYYELSSKVEKYQDAKKSGQFLLFLMAFVIGLMIMAEFLLIHSCIQAEKEENSRVVCSLRMLGMIDKEMVKCLCYKNFLRFIPPSVVGTILSFLPSYYLNESYGMGTNGILAGIVFGVILTVGIFVVIRRYSEKEEKLYELSDFIGCMSPANCEYVLKHNPAIDAAKVEICPNSVKLQERLKGDRKESELLKELNIPASKRIFIYGGNLGKPQGIDFLLKVIEENKKRDDSYFVIVGSGTEYMRVKLWFDTHLPQNACLLAALPKAKYDELVSLCDVGLIFLDKRFTIPNFPSRLLSYLECSMPVLMATDVNTDIGRIAEEGGFGLWTENGNIDTFMEMIEFMVEDDKRMKEMGERGYRFLCENYTVDKSYKAIMKHF